MSNFAIYSVPVGNGFVAMSPLPGGGGDYTRDLEVLRNWKPDLVISMTTDIEMLRGGAVKLGDDLRSSAIKWAPLPVKDFGAPPASVEAVWAEVSSAGASILARGGRVLVHCRGGCGRSGMIVLRLMVEHGEHPDAALNRLRLARPCAVETGAQKAWAARPG